jgi:hypothetical protein
MNVPKGPFSTLEAHLFKEITAGMDNSPIQRYDSSLHGSVNTGEAVLLEEELLLPIYVWSKVATIIPKVGIIFWVGRLFASTCWIPFLYGFEQPQP